MDCVVTLIALQMRYRRFLALSTFDMAIHSSDAPYSWGGVEGLDMHALWVAIYTDLAGYPPADKTFMPATWYATSPCLSSASTSVYCTK